MQLTRRPDCDSQTRSHSVMLAWLQPGVYGKRTHIANDDRRSRTVLSQLLWAANRQ
jgi:hypothetical protein